MNIVYIKYNRERLPEFQTVTKIFKKDNGEKIISKEQIDHSFSTHIIDMYNNYKILTEKYNISLCKPYVNNNLVFFEYIDGTPVDKLLITKLEDNDLTGFYELIDLYCLYLEGMVEQKKAKFNPTQIFCEVLGEHLFNEEFDIINIANIDLIFNNLYMKDENFIQIDYEWVFNFPIMKEFLLWRSIYTFCYYFKGVAALPPIDSILERYDLKKYSTKFFEMEKSFQEYVFGKDYLYRLNYLNNPSCKTIETIIAEKDFEIESLRNSMSWKITKPLRYIKQKLSFKK